MPADIHDVLLPDLPIIDPHHHLWDLDPAKVPDVLRSLPTKRYLLDEILVDIGTGHRIVATVGVEAGAFYRADGPPELRSVGETEFFNGIGAMSASGRYGDSRVCAGIVGKTDLSVGTAAARAIEAHMTAGGERFRGFRQSGATDPSSDVPQAPSRPPLGLYGSTGFRRGVAELAKRHLTFDAWLFHPQLSDVGALARDNPELQIVLNHAGTPLGVGPYAGREGSVFALWRQAMSALADYPNVSVKLSGLAMVYCGLDPADGTAPLAERLADRWRPWVLACIDIFGPSRCIFASNFPADGRACDYRTLWNVFKLIAAGWSQEDRADLFHRTAARIYRIDLP